MNLKCRFSISSMKYFERLMPSPKLVERFQEFSVNLFLIIKLLLCNRYIAVFKIVFSCHLNFFPPEIYKFILKVIYIFNYIVHIILYYIYKLHLFSGMFTLTKINEGDFLSEEALNYKTGF